MNCNRTLLVLALTLLLALGGRAEAEPAFRESHHGDGELRYVDEIPVVVVRGTPEQLGRQQAALTAAAADVITTYPQSLLETIGRADRWAKFLELGRPLFDRFPPDHRAELEAFAAQSGIDRELLLAVNVMVDTYRGGFGCSSLLIEPPRSATGQPIFGRNLDFFTNSILQKYSLVVIAHPRGKHAFASVAFPGMLGCFSGMNDAGLALATHEVLFTRDGSALFNPEGIPYSMVFRRVLEECADVEEAGRLLRSCPRTTMFSLAVCDRRRAAVYEMTPQRVEVRYAENGLLACTNHFRTEPLATFVPALRYRTLMQSQRLAKVGVDDVAQKLHEVNMGRLTVQTMIFEPGQLRLRLAIGSCPASALPLKPLDLAELLRPASPSAAADGGGLKAPHGGNKMLSSGRHAADAH